MIGCLFLITGCEKSKQAKPENVSEPNITVKNFEKKSEENEEEISTEEETQEADMKTESGMELKGVTERVLSVLEIEKEKIEKELLAWTSKNGYASAIGVAFYDPMWVYFSEDKYSIDGYLIFDSDGNGIRPDDEQKKITMDYYKTKRRIEFHE